MMIKHFLLAMLLVAVGVEASGQSFTNTTRVKDLEDRQTITAIAIDDENNKYIGTDQGLLRIDHSGVVETIIPSASIHALAWSKRQGLWAAIDSNVLVQPESGRRIPLEGEQLRIQSMDFSGSQLWVGTNDGLHEVSVRNEKTIKRYGPENSKLLSSNIRYVYVDPSLIKWIGTDKGVARVVNDKWKIYEKDARINAITSNVEGVWIASDNEMWLVDAYNRWYPTAVEDGLSAGEVRALTADNKGKLYILSDKLIQFDPYTDNIVELEHDYPASSDARVAIMCDMDDNLWMGSLDNGLVTLDMEVSEDAPLEAFVAVQHPSCAGLQDGSIEVNASGGAPPYSYIWGNAGITGRHPQGLAPGRYTLTVTDATGQSYAHEISLESPRPLEISIEEVQGISVEGASDGVLRVQASGGTGDYTYAWSNGGNSRTIRNAPAGTVSVTLRDREGCSATIEYLLADGPPPVIAEIEPEVPEQTETADDDPLEQDDEPAEPLKSVDSENLKTLDAASLALGQTLRIEQLYFDADSSVIRPESHPVLDEVYTFLRNNEGIVIEIGGHTNGLPEHAYCDRLSSARARNVAEYLYQKGIPRDRIAFKGYGKRQPIATNETVMGRRQNQRVEIKILQI